MAGERYRPEIDGLRAIAVSAVLLFHSDAPGFDGGYLGVDIFFVISGYLITRIILRSVDAGDFSFGAFYLRRLRRLGPALIATLAATLFAGALMLTPEHMRNLGASAAFSAISMSNIYFWLQSGYFDASAVHKPLLHTWSLGVEEQFYLVWPALILLIAKIARRFLWPTIFALGLISLSAAEARFGAHQAEVFFHFPYRIFEFVIGALALPVESAFSRAGPLLRNIVTMIALATIAGAVHFYDAISRVPGLEALAPSIATAAIIVAGDGRASRLILQNPASLFLGRISYSLYLVHWPLIVFLKYMVDERFDATQMLIAITASGALGWLSFRFVETPFRRPKAQNSLRPPQFAAAAIAGLSAAAVAGGLAWKMDGWPWRVNDDISAVAASLPAMKDELFANAAEVDRGEFPRAGARNAVILGDSHGANLLNALLAAGSPLNYRHMHIQWMCGLYFGERAFGEGAAVSTREEAARCEAEADKVRDNSALDGADYILISSTWRPEALERFPAFLQYLKSRYKAKIIVFGPRYFFMDPNAVFKNFEGFAAANERFYAARNEIDFVKADVALKNAAASNNADYFEIQPLICRSGEPALCPLFSEKREILYFDWHHWSPAGERIIGAQLRQSRLAEALF